MGELTGCRPSTEGEEELVAKSNTLLKCKDVSVETKNNCEGALVAILEAIYTVFEYQYQVLVVMKVAKIWFCACRNVVQPDTVRALLKRTGAISIFIVNFLKSTIARVLHSRLFFWFCALTLHKVVNVLVVAE